MISELTGVEAGFTNWQMRNPEYLYKGRFALHLTDTLNFSCELARKCRTPRDKAKTLSDARNGLGIRRGPIYRLEGGPGYRQPSELKGVKIAVKSLSEDLERVTRKRSEILQRRTCQAWDQDIVE